MFCASRRALKAYKNKHPFRPSGLLLLFFGGRSRRCRASSSATSALYGIVLESSVHARMSRNMSVCVYASGSRYCAILQACRFVCVCDCATTAFVHNLCNGIFTCSRCRYGSIAEQKRRVFIVLTLPHTQNTLLVISP